MLLNLSIAFSIGDHGIIFRLFAGVPDRRHHFTVFSSSLWPGSNGVDKWEKIMYTTYPLRGATGIRALSSSA